MTNKLKEIVFGTIFAVLVFFTAVLTIHAWDQSYTEKLKRDFIRRSPVERMQPGYLERVKELMPPEFKFQDWGYPEYDKEF